MGQTREREKERRVKTNRISATDSANYRVFNKIAIRMNEYELLEHSKAIFVCSVAVVFSRFLLAPSKIVFCYSIFLNLQCLTFVCVTEM